tara:strand:- start:98 stop:472 length:375 start_codon:yes stop_codon:yes gene_type:complete
MKIFSGVNNLERIIDYHLERHGVLTSNLTNADTPNYRPRELIFGDSLTRASAIQKTNAGHVEGLDTNPYILQKSEEPINLDNNGVRLEKAMTKLAGNKIRFETGLDLVRRRLAILKYAATNGGR